jgi:hypothetical protein
MAQPIAYTFQDAVDHLVYNFHGGAQDATLRDVKQAVINAYNAVQHAFDWKYYWTHGRITVAAPSSVTFGYSTSTYVYTTSVAHGISEANCPYYRLKYGNVVYPIDDYGGSATTLRGNQTLNPGTTLSSVSGTLFRSEYPLPHDFKGMGDPIGEGGSSIAGWVAPDHWLYCERAIPASGSATEWSIMADEHRPGGFKIVLDPYPSSATTYDFIYQRVGRPLRYGGVETAATVGTLSNSASGTAVTGVATTFGTDMVGSVLRVGTSTTNAPTGQSGDYPYDEQRLIDTRSSNTACTVFPAFDNAHSAVKYTISDPVDIWSGMWQLFIRRCELELAIARGKDVDRVERQYLRELVIARENDRLVKLQWNAIGRRDDEPGTIDTDN